jgi:levansucrase
MSTSVWRPEAVATIDRSTAFAAPIITRADVPPLLPGIHLWDLWPVQTRTGATAEIAGGALFMLLSAPTLPNPDDRHAIARIRLMHRVGGDWRDLGPLLPDGFAPGSREWAGSAILSDSGGRVTLYFTAAGRRGESAITFEQRLFETSAELHVDGSAPRLIGWTPPIESVAPDGVIYVQEMAGGRAIGTIKAFRDPAWFRDPVDDSEYLLFTASLAQSRSNWNGAVGVARREEGRWRLLPPIITADELNNELERPHVVMHGGRYYCFWSTQAKVFAAGGPVGPNGLYGMVADALSGPWAPLNGSGLVLANPPAAPFQAYSWLVLADLSVLSFADLIGVDHVPSDPAQLRAHFGGTPAPAVRLAIDGDRAGPRVSR